MDSIPVETLILAMAKRMQTRVRVNSGLKPNWDDPYSGTGPLSCDHNYWLQTARNAFDDYVDASNEVQSLHKP